MNSGAQDTGQKYEREQANAMMVWFNRDTQDENRRTIPRVIDDRSHFGLLKGLFGFERDCGTLPAGVI